MTGKEIIEFIQENHLEDAKVTVTATRYYDGDHDCYTTDDVNIYKSREYDGKNVIDFYVNSNLY